MDRILIVGATGAVGGAVVEQLVAAGVPGVSALSRNPDAARLPLGIEVVRGDLTMPESLDNCLAGVDAVFLVWTAPAALVPAAIERIARTARRIVLLSSPYKTAHPLFQQPNPMRVMHAQLEAAIISSGLDWTVLRPGMFARNCLGWWAPSIRSGDVVRWPYLGVPTAPVDERDIAAVAVQALCEDGHAGAEYVLTGPQSLTQAEQLSAIGHAIGRHIEVEEISPEKARKELLSIMPAVVIDMLLSAWAAAEGQPAFVSHTFYEVTGVPPRSFSDWAVDHAHEFLGAAA
jgi:uncharacterized protein YbjT (DUF2867 family)